MSERKVNADALALRWALASTYSRLRDEAIRIVATALDQEDGVLRRTAARLKVDHHALKGWLDEVAELQAARIEFARRRTSGRLPRELES